MNRLTEIDKQRLRVKLCDIKRRCYNKTNMFYKDYGARGITVCDEWLDKEYGHENFRKWAMISGYKNGLSIDRINNNLGYSPNNCRWATAKQQANNRRTNNLLTINNVTKTVTEWADKISLVCRGKRKSHKGYIFKFKEDLQ